MNSKVAKQCVNGKGPCPGGEENRSHGSDRDSAPGGAEKQRKLNMATGALPRMAGKPGGKNISSGALPRGEEKKANTFRQGLCLGGKKRKQKHFDRGSAPGGENYFVRGSAPGGRKENKYISKGFAPGGRKESKYISTWALPRREEKKAKQFR